MDWTKARTQLNKQRGSEEEPLQLLKRHIEYRNGQALKPTLVFEAEFQGDWQPYTRPSKTHTSRDNEAGVVVEYDARVYTGAILNWDEHKTVCRATGERMQIARFQVYKTYTVLYLTRTAGVEDAYA